jgi:hypothetical protein
MPSVAALASVLIPTDDFAPSAFHEDDRPGSEASSRASSSALIRERNVHGKGTDPQGGASSNHHNSQQNTSRVEPIQAV